MRPFFSVIIPCHDSHPDRINNLLDSIVSQYIPEDIEVIISDDDSSDTSYLNVVDTYKNDLNIKIVHTVTDCHCPGNTRHFGVQEATGKWITFIDHDDVFIPETFSKIKDIIISNEVQYVAVCNFKEIDPVSNRVHQEMIRTTNWMHGKFYNLDNFWKARNIHFKPNLISHEDIYVSTVVTCELFELQSKEPFYINLSCYLWRAFQDSLSRSFFSNDSYLEHFYKSYIESTGEVFLSYWMMERDNNNLSHKSWYLLSCVEIILHMYFYTQGFKYNRPFDYRLDVDVWNKDYIRRVYKEFEVSEEFILNEIYYKKASDWYLRVKRESSVAIGDIIEFESFKEFINVQ